MPHADGGWRWRDAQCCLAAAVHATEAVEQLQAIADGAEAAIGARFAAVHNMASRTPRGSGLAVQIGLEAMTKLHVFKRCSSLSRANQ
jgi:hypothetical protein